MASRLHKPVQPGTVLSGSQTSNRSGSLEMGGTVPPDRSLGEFGELGTNYDGSYKPARMGLLKTLDSGKMRNPLTMPQSGAPWSSRRPLSATRPGSRAQSEGRLKGSSSPSRKNAQSEWAAASGKVPSTAGDDSGSGMLWPQRIELPAYLNTPPRKPDDETPTPEERTRAALRIQDLELLVFACHRAAKLREEGRAHFSLGVLRDNIRQYHKAIDSYNHFFRVCKECNDGQGCALAYHCIAVDYQLLGSDFSRGQLPPPEEQNNPNFDSGKETTAKPELLRKAIYYHNQHRENSDSVGKFVAHLNMGLACAQLGEREASTVNHQYALRYALQLHSLEGQSLAIGSLGFSAGMYDNDPDKMRSLIERYVDLCTALKQPRKKAFALKKLGIIASQQGDTERSMKYFQQAIDEARSHGDHEAEKDCCVRLGIAAGQAKMAEHIGSILQNAVVHGHGNKTTASHAVTA